MRQIETIHFTETFTRKQTPSSGKLCSTRDSKTSAVLIANNRELMFQALQKSGEEKHPWYRTNRILRTDLHSSIATSHEVSGPNGMFPDTYRRFQSNPFRLLKIQPRETKVVPGHLYVDARILLTVPEYNCHLRKSFANINNRRRRHGE